MAGVELEKSVAKEWGGEVERSRGKQKRQACEAYKQAVKGYGCGLCVCVCTPRSLDSRDCSQGFYVVCQLKRLLRFMATAGKGRGKVNAVWYIFFALPLLPPLALWQ